VIGVDSDPDAIAQAQRRGVPAATVSWPEFDTAPVDAIAFTRSLHHIGPLREAVGRARELVKPDGLLLLEDFAFDEASDETLRWFLEGIRQHPGRTLINHVAGELVTDLLDSTNPTATWRHRREHELHSIAAMTRAIEERFVVREKQSVPYLYRYLVPVLGETAVAAELVAEVIREEARVGERGEIMLIGRRVVASPPTGASERVRTTNSIKTNPTEET
jgi:SAM-dependent methyltransferase